MPYIPVHSEQYDYPIINDNIYFKARSLIYGEGGYNIGHDWSWGGGGGGGEETFYSYEKGGKV